MHGADTLSEIDILDAQAHPLTDTLPGGHPARAIEQRDGEVVTAFEMRRQGAAFVLGEHDRQVPRRAGACDFRQIELFFDMCRKRKRPRLNLVLGGCARLGCV